MTFKDKQDRVFVPTPNSRKRSILAYPVNAHTHYM